LSWRGLDNASYYRLVPGQERHHINDTGTGNTLNVPHPRVLQMVTDSLRYWVECYHVDGFRFDLGSILGRELTGFDPNSGFFDAVRQDPVLSRVKLISEPWDLGPGGYQLGNHPPGFGEWNDRFRDGVRQFWNGASDQRGDLAALLSGSAELFDHGRRRPSASVNFLASHDGFTLHDLVTYEQRHNEANGENGADGHANNQSRNWGVEGETDDPEINATRGAVKRAMLATMFASAGTPMLMAGDEMNRTQGGNNNAYCQDNQISYLDWQRAAGEEARLLTDFTARLIALRQRYEGLRPSHFLHGDAVSRDGIRDVAWFDQHGQEITPEAWGEPEARTLTLRRAIALPSGKVELILVLLNADSAPQEFVLPGPEVHWTMLLDTALPEVAACPLDADRARVEADAVMLLVGWLP
jgi:isoamylase